LWLVAVFYFKLSRLCPIGNKKGLRFAPKALIFLELAMGIEPATGWLQIRWHSLLRITENYFIC